MKMLYHVDQADFSRIVNNSNLSAIERTAIYAQLARINTLYMIAKAGSGHIGSSFSSMDIFAWLYLNELTDDDVFFSSKGHDVPGLYSVLIGLGKLGYENIHQLRRLHGLPGHPDISTSCIATNTGSLGMGVSKAKGMAKANRLEGKKAKIYVLTGDGELQEGQFWESLPGAVNNKFNEITAIVDHNKIQSDTWVANVSHLGDLDAKFSSNGWHVLRCDGNNLESFSQAIAAANKIKNRPQVIIADTIKGCGVSFMESTSMKKDQEFYTFHSGAPTIEEYENAASELIDKTNALLTRVQQPPIKVVQVAREVNSITQNNNIQRLISAYEKALHKISFEHENIIVLDADLMLDCGLLSFRDRYPDRFIECGIAEQDMVSQAGALALNGKLPISHSFACFLAARACEQFYNNASEQTKCIYVGSLAGLLPSGPGHSHQMVRDISILGGIPGLILLEPCCEEEVELVLKYAVRKNSKSTYIRLVSIPYEVPYKLPSNYVMKEGQGVALTEGKDAIVFAYGPIMLTQACLAAEELRQKYKIGIKVINLPWLNIIDHSWLKQITSNIKYVFTIDNHLIAGGQGEKIGAAIAQIAFRDLSFNMLGLTEIPACGSNDEILAHYGLNANSIQRHILNVLNK